MPFSTAIRLPLPEQKRGACVKNARTVSANTIPISRLIGIRLPLNISRNKLARNIDSEFD